MQKLSSIARVAERKPGPHEVTEIKRREYFREGMVHCDEYTTEMIALLDWLQLLE